MVKTEVKTYNCGRNSFEYKIMDNGSGDTISWCKVTIRYKPGVHGAFHVITGENAATCIARFHMTPEMGRPQLLSDYMIRAQRKKKGFWEPINGRS